MTTGNKTTQDRAEDWFWDRSGGYRSLAKFVNVRALDGLGLADTHATDELTRSADVPATILGITRRLYETLSEHGYAYGNPRRHLAGKQQIRDPASIAADSGTCLDLALLFAAMCVHAGLRPFVTVLENHPGREDHALVVVDLSRPASRIGRSAAPISPETEAEGARDPWGVRRLVPGREPAALTADGLAVEVTGVCPGKFELDFDRACREGAKTVTDRGYADVHLVDVVRVRQADPQRAELPAPPAADGRIYQNLPQRRPFTAYRSRGSVLGKLRRATGTVVLYGASGTGKSMLAQHVATNVGHGRAWFLDASSEQALTTALAGTEVRAKARPLAEVDGPEQAMLARNARRRLAAANASWIVVLDNANDGPDALRSVPRPDPILRQLLIVTTTSGKWRGDGRRFIELDPLELSEVRENLEPDAPAGAIAGRPLLIEASRRFRQETGRWWWTEHPADPGDPTGSAPGALWAAARPELSPAEAGLARTIAWLPPVAISAETLSSTGGADTRASLARLGRLGLVDVASDEVTMHRLFRAAIRADGLSRDLPAEVAAIDRILLAEATRRLMETNADLESAHEMGRVVKAWPDTEVAVSDLHALGVLFERHATAQDSAAWYRDALQRTGWAPGQEPQGEFRPTVVDSLRGIARAVMRGTQDDDKIKRGQALEEAIGWTDEAQRLCDGHPGLALAASRAEAMQGLLLRARSSTAERRSREALGYLRRAEKALRHSHQIRVKLVKNTADSPDVDRSQFNLAGLEVRLAQEDAPEAAAEHLDEAETHYAQVLKVRETRYKTRELEEVVCCIFGAALVAYYRTVLLPGTLDHKTRLLRQAEQGVSESAAIRQHLAGARDDEATSKSLALAAKIALARLHVIKLAGGRGERDGATIGSYQGEQPLLTSTWQEHEPA
jgi:AAA domain